LKTESALIVAAFSFILHAKYSGYTIYFHNFAGFDANFIVKHLIALESIDLQPIAKNGKLIELKIKYGKRVEPNKSGSIYKYSVKIYDSMLILPSSLDKLGKTFGSENKSMFPLKVLNDPMKFPFDYKGKVPGLEYFYIPNRFKIKEYAAFMVKYNEYKNSFIGRD
jgi:hypothetical protein